MGALAPKRNFFHLTGHGLIYIGILVWAPYFYLKLVAQQAVEVINYLPYHLTGVLGGIMVLGLGYLIKRSNRQPPGR
jgi:hypothetical protein